MKERLHVRLVHMKPEEANERIKTLREAGFEPDYNPVTGPALLKAINLLPPAAIVIDLSRLPSHGRDVAHALRSRKSTRLVPLVFAGGEPDKVERCRQLLPDAAFCEWKDIRKTLNAVISAPPDNPVRPSGVMAAYAGRTLPQKLGILEGSTVVLWNAPLNWTLIFRDLPPGASIRLAPAAGDLHIWFVRGASCLDEHLPRRLRHAGPSPIWIAWPKKQRNAPAVLSQDQIRKAAMALGWVDCKICSIDDTWSGLLFRRRRPRVEDLR